MRCFLWKHNTLEVNYNPFWISGERRERVSTGNIMWLELQHEGIGTEAAGTSQLQDWNVERNSLESKRQTQEFENRRCRRSQCLF